MRRLADAAHPAPTCSRGKRRLNKWHIKKKTRQKFKTQNRNGQKNLKENPACIQLKANETRE